MILQLEEENSKRLSLIKQLILIVDTFENAAYFIMAAAEQAWKEQMEKVMDSIREAMYDAGIDEVEAQGCIFDNAIHEVVEVIFDKDKRYREIISVEKKGYIYNGTILRKAKVVVNNYYNENDIE